MNKFTKQMAVWISDSTDSANLNAGSPDHHFNLFSPTTDMSAYGYIRAGSAEVEITMFEHDDIVVSAVESLRKQVQTVRADAEMKSRVLEDKIQQLLAITCEVPA